jgi:hypothetical protein
MISPYSAGNSDTLCAFEGVIERKEKSAKRKKGSFLALLPNQL